MSLRERFGKFLIGKPVEFDYQPRYGASGSRPEKNPKLHVYERYYTFREMVRRVPVVAAFDSLLQRSMESVVVTFEDGNVERARNLLGPLLSPKGVYLISKSATHGFSIVEYAFGNDGNIEAFQELPQETIYEFRVGANNEVTAFVQRTSSGRHYIPRAFTVYTTSGRGPRGEGIYLNVADVALKWLANDDASHLGANDNLSRHPNVFMDAKTASGKLGQLVKKIINQKDFDPRNRFFLDSAVYESEANDSSINLAQGARKHIVEYPPELVVPNNDRTQHYTQQLALVLGMEAFVLGMNREGSKALAETVKTTFDSFLRGVMLIYQNAIQDLIEFQYTIRGWRNIPKVKVDTLPLPNASAQADVLVKMAQAGISLTSPQGKQLLEGVLLTTKEAEEGESAKPNGVDLLLMQQQLRREGNGPGNG